MKRNEKIDVLRGWAIILVVFGHCMEYASGHEFFSVNGIYNNLIFKVIYSFHMPLFACISGWLFGSTIEKYASFDIISRKSDYPYCLLDYIVDAVKRGIEYNTWKY